MRLIGITGFKTSGKDTTAKGVALALPEKNVKRVAFADKLKELTALTFGIQDDLIATMDYAKQAWTLACYDDDGNELFDITGRAILQNIGQGARQVFQSDIWVDAVLPKYTGNSPAGSGVDQAVHDMYPGVDVLVVTDVRYPNEADRVHQLGGEVWSIIRPGTESDGHSSEIPLPSEKVDLSIFNGYTIETLYQSAANALIGNVHPFRENAGV